MDGKICMVTGGTSGIGKATSLALARMGATIIVVGRDQKKSKQTVDKMRTVSGNSLVDYLIADLSSQKDIYELAKQFKNQYNHLDILVNNAGAKFVLRKVTVDGYEMTFALNHLAYFLLTNLLLDVLKDSGNARIINVSSGAHRGISGIAFDDLQSQKAYIGKRAYAQSKLANVIFTYELSRRLQGTGITANALAPPGTASNFCKNNGMISWFKHITAHVLAGNLVGPAEALQRQVSIWQHPLTYRVLPGNISSIRKRFLLQMPLMTKKEPGIFGK